MSGWSDKELVKFVTTIIKIKSMLLRPEPIDVGWKFDSDQGKVFRTLSQADYKKLHTIQEQLNFDFFSDAKKPFSNDLYSLNSVEYRNKNSYELLIFKNRKTKLK